MRISTKCSIYNKKETPFTTDLILIVHAELHSCVQYSGTFLVYFIGKMFLEFCRIIKYLICKGTTFIQIYKIIR